MRRHRVGIVQHDASAGDRARIPGALRGVAEHRLQQGFIGDPKSTAKSVAFT
jgi:hypothetical protein